MKRNPHIELQDKRDNLAKQEANLIEVYYMSEDEACQRWNVDYKDEAIDIIEEAIESLRSDIATLEESLEAEAEAERPMFHHAFPTETTFWRFKY